MNPRVLEEYRKARRLHIVGAYSYQAPASYAISAARTRAEWTAAGGAIRAADDDGRAFDSIWDEGADDAPVRLLIHSDWDTQAALDFECCPAPETGKPNTGARWQSCDCTRRRDHDPAYTAYENKRRCDYGASCRHECDLARRIEREGVYGIIAQYRGAAGEWQEADSCWGYVGDDWQDEAPPFMRAALDARKEVDFRLTTGDGAERRIA